MTGLADLPILASIRPRVAGGHRLALLLPLLLSALLFAAACEDDDPANGNGDATETETPTVSPTAENGAETTPTPDGDGGQGSLPASPPVGFEMVADDLTAPVDLDGPDDGSGRLFIVEQTGTIRIATADGDIMEEPFLDISDRLVDIEEGYDERGLLGLAFHPDYAENGRFFVYYSAPLRDEAPQDWNHTSHLSEFTVSGDDENSADPANEQVLMRIDQPQSNHNGGHITFGLDGYLYIPLGDGGNANDVGVGHTEDLGNGQDRTNLLGSILRIDVDAEGTAERPYGIPQDNPFVGGDGEEPEEIWVYGLRNPYDISVDPEGEYGVLISDAGQELFEEVSLATEPGQNFGWHIKEGTHCFSPETPEEPPEECPDEGPFGVPLRNPVVEYHRSEFGTVISGAHIYRGEMLPDFQGMMIFSDWSYGGGANGAIFLAQPNDNMAATGVDEGLWEFVRMEIVTELEGAEDDALGRYIPGLVRGADNELYILANTAAGPEPGAGEVYRLVAADGAAGEGAGGASGSGDATDGDATDDATGDDATSEDDAGGDTPPPAEDEE